MAKTLKLAFLVAILLQVLSACGTGHSRPRDTWVPKRMIKWASYSPAKTHINDVVLIHYKLATIFLPGEDADQVILPAYLAENGGEVIPLLDPPYTVGGPLPTFEDAKAALQGPLGSGGYRGEDDYYAYFRAPSEPGFVTIEFFIGSSDSFYAPKAKHSMTLTILP